MNSEKIFKNLVLCLKKLRVIPNNFFALNVQDYLPEWSLNSSVLQTMSSNHNTIAIKDITV